MKTTAAGVITITTNSSTSGIFSWLLSSLKNDAPHHSGLKFLTVVLFLLCVMFPSQLKASLVQGGSNMTRTICV
jgi:hypothetical protein